MIGSSGTGYPHLAGPEGDTAHPFRMAAKEKVANFRQPSATLGEVSRALELASKLGRLASGMATDKTELTGEDGAPIKVELEVALKKIYGVAAPPAKVEVRPPNVEEPQESQTVIEAEVIND